MLKGGRVKTHLWVLFFLCLTTCVTTKHQNTTATVEESARAPVVLAGPEYENTKNFDALLRHALSRSEVAALEASCKVENKNPFCPAILDPSLYEKKTPSLSRRRRWITPARPHFSQGKVTNWYQLRFASTDEVIRGTGRLALPQLLILKDMAVNEPLCPNNAAIAVAANLESFLEDKYFDTVELAKLYHKGTTCLTDPKDKENLATRAALFYFMNKDYPKALSILKEVVALENLSTARPLYWMYRSYLAVGDLDSAKSTLYTMRTKYPFSFHTLIALTSEKQDPGEDLLNNDNPAAKKRSAQSPGLNLLIKQVELLRQYGFEESASRILNATILQAEDAEPEVKLYLAELKDDEDDHSGKFSILSSVLLENPQLISRKTAELYFPKAYFPIFEKHSAGLDPYLLLAIARQESAFNPNAVSRANARGLLQVLPSTRRRVYPRGPANLLDPAANVQVGARYFTNLLEQSNGQVHLALAAYNAGPSKVVAWAKRYPSMEPMLFIDLIPYRETRNYVASILRNYFWYRRIHDDEVGQILMLQQYTPDFELAGHPTDETVED